MKTPKTREFFKKEKHLMVFLEVVVKKHPVVNFKKRKIDQHFKTLSK